MGFTIGHKGRNVGLDVGLGGAVMGNSNSTYVWTNADAETYYDALVTAQGDDLWINSIYGISINAYKQGLDNLFVSGASDGWFAKMIGMYLFQGSVVGANVINAFLPATNNLTAINSPTYDINGAVLNGTSQYFKTGISQNPDGTLNNLTYAIKTINVTSTGVDSYMGASNGITQRNQLVHQTTITSLSSYTTTEGAGKTSVNATRNTFLLATRRASNDVEIYQDGVSIATDSGSGGTRSTYENYIGTQNNIGVPTNYVDGTIQFASIGLGLTTAQQLSLYNAYTTFATLIGR